MSRFTGPKGSLPRRDCRNVCLLSGGRESVYKGFQAVDRYLHGKAC
jgi:hypothetical protein